MPSCRAQLGRRCVAAHHGELGQPHLGLRQRQLPLPCTSPAASIPATMRSRNRPRSDSASAAKMPNMERPARSYRLGRSGRASTRRPGALCAAILVCNFGPPGHPDHLRSSRFRLDPTTRLVVLITASGPPFQALSGSLRQVATGSLVKWPQESSPCCPCQPSEHADDNRLKRRSVRSAQGARDSVEA